MNSLIEKCEAFIGAKKLLRYGQSVLVALSGGLDSVVLLNVLCRLAASHRWKLTVAHFNHQLRGAASDMDEKLARKTARSLGLRVVVGRGNVREFARRNGVSMEMAARKLRHDFLAQAARKQKIPTIALAHHADDQLELFLLRLFRGAGSDGLAGMPASAPSPRDPRVELVRPLLERSKTELAEFAKANGIEFSEDATNACLDMQRNRIRHELIPLLRAHYQPALDRAVFKVMDIVGAEAEFVKAAADEWVRLNVSGGRGGTPRKPEGETPALQAVRGPALLIAPGGELLQAGGAPASFEALPLALQRRVIRLQLMEMKLPAEFGLIERLRMSPDQPFVIKPGCSVVRGENGLIRFQETARADFNLEALEIPLSKSRGRRRFKNLVFSWVISEKAGMDFLRQTDVEYFDADKIGPEIRLRCWKAGDRFQPSGFARSAKLQDLFTSAKVPPDERRRRVVAATVDGKIFWVQGLRIGEGFKLAERTVRRLKWSWREANPRENSQYRAEL